MHEPSEHAAHAAHVVPWRTLFAVFAALVALTVLTVVATRVDLGRLNLAVALGIATTKAALVLLYFMHLRWERRFNAVVLGGTLLFAALFVALTLLDSKTYQPELIPGYAPAVTPR